MAGTGNNEDATDLFSETLAMVEGDTGAYGRVTSYQYEINGVLTDIIVSQGNNGVEFYTMNPDTGDLTLMTREMTGLTSNQTYEDGDFFESNGSLYWVNNWDLTDDNTNSVTAQGTITYKMDSTTGQWSIISQNKDDDFTALDGIANPETTGDLTMSVFEGADGNTYAWVDGGYGTGVAGHFYSKIMWDSTNETWVDVPSTDNTTELTVGVNGVTLTDWRADTGLIADNLGNPQNMRVIETADGLKLLQAGGTATNNMQLLTMWDLDDNGNLQYDADGNPLRITYNLYKGTSTYGDGTAGPSWDASSGPTNSGFLMQHIEVDPNGNIFMAGGSSSAPNVNYYGGVFAINPTDDTIATAQRSGVSLTTATNVIGQIGAAADITFDDGKIYITSQHTTTVGSPYTIILDQSDYSIIDQDRDINSFSGGNGLADGYVYVTSVTGETFLVQREQSTSSSDLWVAQTSVGESTIMPSMAVCFVRGTKILTDQGERNVETLQVGDWVKTSDNGYQPIAWIGKRRVSNYELLKNPKLYPVRIARGALGEGLPKSDLFVSPQHRILVSSKIAKRMFNSNEVLIAANKLVLIDGICFDEQVESVEYYHILFDRHEIVYANGAEAESLYLGKEALKGITPKSRQEILALFPEVEGSNFFAKPARPLVSGKRGKKMIYRHAENNQNLWSNKV